MSAFSILNIKAEKHRKPTRNQHGVLNENLSLEHKLMEIFKRKKAVFFPNNGGSSAKETSTSDGKQHLAERRVLSDNSNISQVDVFSKKQSNLVSACPKATRSKPTFRATPGTRKLRKSRQTKQNTCIVGPERIVPFDEPMELDDPLLKLRTILKTVPVGVDDIDSGEGEFYSSQYAQDIIDYLQAVEARWTFPVDYLEEQVEVTPGMRSVLVDWLIQVQVHEGIQEDTLHLAVAMIDRYTCMKVPELSQVQLLGVTCLLIAAKYIERFPPEVSTLCHLTDNTYTEDEVFAMELEVLKRLKFDLNIPGPIVFLDRFLKAENNDTKVEHLCRYLLDLSLVNVNNVQFVSSKLAASAIYLSRKLLGSGYRETWSLNLAFYTKYSEGNLQTCVGYLDRLLAKVPNAKYKAAFNKYKKSQYDSISTHPRVYQE